MKVYPSITILALALCSADLQTKAQTLQWAAQLQATSASQFVASGVAVDPMNAVYTVGHFSGTVDVDPGPGVLTISSAGVLDAIIVKLSPSGQYLGHYTFGGAGAQVRGTSIAITSMGEVVFSGTAVAPLTLNLDPE